MSVQFLAALQHKTCVTGPAKAKIPFQSATKRFCGAISPAKKEWRVSPVIERDKSDEPITIKKYANRRLYNTATSSYVTLDHLCEMVKDGQDFQVIDAKSGDDITRSVLTQIIVEEESKGQNLLPVKFLRQLIKFYGDAMQGYLPGYLQLSMEQFVDNQDRLRSTVQSTLGAAPEIQKFDEQIRKNMEIFENTMEMFSPFSGPARQSKPREPGKESAAEEEANQIDQLKEQMAEMQAKLNALAEQKN